MTDPVFERYKDALKAGHVAVMRGRPKDALEHYAEAARLADHRPLPHVSMAGVLLQMGRAAEALAAYDRALARAPTDRDALNGRAAALAAAGRRADAAATLEQVARLDTDAARRREEEASSRAQAALREGDPEALVGMADAAEQAHDHKGAMAAFLGASAGYARRGQHDAALDACHRALALELGAPEIHFQMARLYFERGWAERGTERLILLDRLLELDGDPMMRRQVAALAHERGAADARLRAITGAAPER
jgi:tetratricopeptide (TPR) repeat protein